MHTSFLLQGVYYKYISLPIVTVDISFMQKYLVQMLTFRRLSVDNTKLL